MPAHSWSPDLDEPIDLLQGGLVAAAALGDRRKRVGGTSNQVDNIHVDSSDFCSPSARVTFFDNSISVSQCKYS